MLKKVSTVELLQPYDYCSIDCFLGCRLDICGGSVA